MINQKQKKMKTLLERIEEVENTIKELKELALKEPKKEKDNFPKTWDGLNMIQGHKIFENSQVRRVVNFHSNYRNQDVTPTEKEALSYLAACQLRQLAKVINDNQNEDEWVDWNNEDQYKYFPIFDHNSKKFKIKVHIDEDFNGIYFKRQEDLERSLIEHKELWLIYSKVSNNV